MAEAETPLVLITGASGFVASHCIKQLQESGEYRLRGTVRSLKNEERCEAIRNLVTEPRYPIELVEANLLEEDGWKKAVEGCMYVLHIASPFFSAAPKHEDEFIKPAVEGTLNVLKAAAEVGGVKRIVVTSSMAALYIGNMTQELTESHWSDAKLADPYSKSKTLAEKAAWDFVNDLPDEKKFELAVVNPGLVLGPVLLGTCESVSLIKKLLEKAMPMVPDIYSPLVDVRDVARAHIKAMTLPEAAGNRHIVTTEVNSFIFLANTLAQEFNSQGYNVPTKKAPKFVLWLMSWFNKEAKNVYPYVGLRLKVNNSRMKEVLQIEPIDITASVVEMAHTMIEKGLADKRPGYRGRSKKEEPVSSKTDEQAPVEEPQNLETKEAESADSSPSKDESTQAESKQAETAQAETVQAETVQAENQQAETAIESEDQENIQA